MKSYQDQFIDAFSEALANGNKELIEECIAFMCEIAERVWQGRFDKDFAYPLETLQNNCRRLLFACAESEKDISKRLFFKLLNRLYKLLFNKILYAKTLYCEDFPITGDTIDSDNSVDRFNDPDSFPSSNIKTNLCVRQYFNILDSWNVYFFFNKILREIDIKLLMDQGKISDLLYKMQVTDFALSIEREQIRKQLRAEQERRNAQLARNEQQQDGNNNAARVNIAGKENWNDWKPDSSILYIQQYMGWYLNKQLHNPDITTEEIIYFARDCVLSNDYLYHINANYEVSTTLARTFSIENAVYICGLITAGLVDVAKDVFLYCVGDNNSHYINGRGNKDEFIAHVAVFCYLYYLGFWEEDEYITPELRSKAKQLTQELSSKYDELFVKHVLLYVLIDELKVEKLKTGEEERFFPHYIYQIMRRFDLRAKQGSSYQIVTEDMVKDFCLFSIARNHPLLYEFNWLSNPEHDLFSYLDYIKDEDATREKLGKFVEFANTNMLAQIKDPEKRENEKERLIQVLFERIKVGITSQYKDERKRKAQIAQEQYEKNVAEIEGRRKTLEKTVCEFIQKQFKEFATVSGEDGKQDTNNAYLAVEIYALRVSTALVSDILQEQANSIAKMAYANLLQQFISILIEKGCIVPKKYDKNDQKYLDFLDKNDFDLLFGARHFFMTFDPEFAENFNKKIEKYTQIIADGYVQGFRSALIKKENLHFYIKNVEVIINDANPYDYNDFRSRGMGLSEEDQKELRVFIAKEEKVITVQAEIRVEVGTTSGYYFE